MDWIDQCLEYTSTFPSPLLFRKWAAISALAGLAERRVYVLSANKPIFPNLYVMLVSRPGVGKDISDFVRTIWKAVKPIHVAADDMTKAVMLDILDAAVRADRAAHLDPAKDDYHFLNIVASEFANFAPGWDTNFFGVLSTMWGCPPNYDESRRGRKGDEEKTKSILKPGLNLIGAIQPSYMASMLPEAAWGQGITRRLMLVYQNTPPTKIRLFDPPPLDESLWAHLILHANRVAMVRGRFLWDAEADKMFQDWYDAGCLPIPTHSRLEGYVTNRHLFAMKLCQVSSLARSTDLVITPWDFERAKSWLYEAEALMPDIFKELQAHPDAQVLEEFQNWVWITFMENKQTPVSGADCRMFLSKCMPSEKVERMLDLAVNSNRVNRLAGGDLFAPSTTKVSNKI